MDRCAMLPALWVDATLVVTIIQAEVRLVNHAGIPYAFSVRRSAMLSASQAWRQFKVADEEARGPREYQSYLLRLWQESAGEPAAVELVDCDEPRALPLWRASLESPGTGERHGFASLEDLYAYLDKKTGSLGPRWEPSEGR
jgi:hypothetical protein